MSPYFTYPVPKQLVGCKRSSQYLVRLLVEENQDADRTEHMTLKQSISCFLVVRIPKHAILSTRSCFLSQDIPFAPYGHAAHLALALALYGEMYVLSMLLLLCPQLLAHSRILLRSFTLILLVPTCRFLCSHNLPQLYLMQNMTPDQPVPCRVTLSHFPCLFVLNSSYVDPRHILSWDSSSPESLVFATMLRV